jgi:hypothetical protein
MRRSVRALLLGVGLLLLALVGDLVGTDFQILVVLIVSFALAIAGSVIAIRGMFEFLSERSERS